MTDPRLPNVDLDPQETREWLEALDAVLAHDGADRARFLVAKLVERAGRKGADLLPVPRTDYVNSIPPEREPPYPGDRELEKKLEAYLRWNAVAMVVRANLHKKGLGGHLGSYASVSTLFEVGLNHFFRGPHGEHRGDLVFFQGHSSPGLYARAFLEGRLSEADLDQFRQEVEHPGVSSYPHPWLMPDFWALPTVSMGLGPLSAIYQARFLKYLEARGLVAKDGRRVWAFLGDGEMDEPESTGALTVAAREGLDNLTFVVNCNLQRLDGPVRGNGKIVQELEGLFRGAGWNVIKLLWGSGWDALLARDTTGALREKLNATLDGQFQRYYTSTGRALMRAELFSGSPALEALGASLSDADLGGLLRGGHDAKKVHAAFAAAASHPGQPTVILAKTVKGFGLGDAAEALNIAHNVKEMNVSALAAFRDRFQVPVSDAELSNLPFLKPAEDAPELVYLKARRAALGGPFPARRHEAPKLAAPGLEAFKLVTDGTREGQSMSTTMAFVRLLTALLRDKEVGPRVVPIVADEARTFGMEGLFKPYKIYAAEGQKYRPVDADEIMPYVEAANGQILQEGISEGGAFASWTAAATAYANHGVPMLPFFIFYSMFGMQRIGDLAWAAADQRARGFLIGATSGRTTLNGEGLQHEDGQSHTQAALIPNCRAYDPTFGYELAVILLDGVRRMVAEQEDVFYYVTVMNENYEHASLPAGAEEGIRRGLYLLRPGAGKKKHRVRLLGSGAILREALAAAEILEADFGVAADVYSATSFTELHREGIAAERWNRLHPADKPRGTWVAELLGDSKAPVVAATDYVRAFPEQIRPWVPARYVTLGTDGFGRSDTREALRRFFEVDRAHIAHAALKALADDGALPASEVAKALGKLGLDAERPAPWTV
ncbi:MAG: pyruvate dehydrogenase (acetyl-transferring), homodimeric type [Thermoanaerobaculia bacterium]|nr:pyruvate dehydrogenase (acetyl-transferring), homodimeric type [Thermoanaerobaculia bacterium]